MKRSRTILHVDDDAGILQLVSKALSEHGYDVVSLSDPTRVLQRISEIGARLVLLDIDMPQNNGLEILQEIKRRDGGVQVIMVTGMVSMCTVVQSMCWGAEACVFKPLTDFTSLLTAIDAAFEKIDRWWESLADLNRRRHNEAEQAAMLIPDAMLTNAGIRAMVPPTSFVWSTETNCVEATRR